MSTPGRDQMARRRHRCFVVHNDSGHRRGPPRTRRRSWRGRKKPLKVRRKLTERLWETVDGKVHDIQNVASRLGSSGEDGACLKSARDAGVPDSMNKLLENPAADSGMMELTLVKTAHETARLAENCAELFE